MKHVSRGARILASATLSAAVVSGVAAVPLAAPAAAATYAPALSAFDTRLLADINHARASYGMRALVAVTGTTDVAHSWSCHMARYLSLAHNPRLGNLLESHGSVLWTTYAENIAVATSTTSADTVFRMYMNSPMHRANILNRANRYIGLWTKVGGSRRWNTIDFVGSTASSYTYSYGASRVGC